MEMTKDEGKGGIFGSFPERGGKEAHNISTETKMVGCNGAIEQSFVARLRRCEGQWQEQAEREGERRCDIKEL